MRSIKSLPNTKAESLAQLYKGSNAQANARKKDEQVELGGAETIHTANARISAAKTIPYYTQGSNVMPWNGVLAEVSC